MVEQKYIDRFWAKVDKTSNSNGCWIWTGSRDGKGYGLAVGVVRKHFGTQLAHRISAKLAGMNINDKDKPLVRHLCHNPLCVNSLHLKTGTYAENSRDMTEANRQINGEKHYCAKLTENDIKEIRNKYSSGNYKLWQLCNTYNVKKSTMSAIINNKTWKHVTY